MLLRWATAGSVDDGKSTLIGRLLVDLGALYRDQYREGQDLAWVTDGLKAEREQSITIDVAYRFFETPRRKFILADTPGHEQFTANMVTGISQVDLVVLLVDARKGLSPQTRRHALLCSLLQVPQVVLAINKMDAVDFEEDVFQRLSEEFRQFCRRLSPAQRLTLPISALQGDNLVHPSPNMPWYTGPTLLQHLESVDPPALRNSLDFRFFVQGVIRPHQDFRGLLGTVASGRIRRGQPVLVLPSQRETSIQSLWMGEEEVQECRAGEAVVVTLQDEIEAGRGSLLCRPLNRPEQSADLDATLFWMDSSPLKPGLQLWLLHGTRQLRVEVRQLVYRLEVHSLHQEPASHLETNEIGRVHLQSFEPLFFDRYDHNRYAGAFVLVDPDHHGTVAAGVLRGSFQAAESTPEVYPQASAVDPQQRQQLHGHQAGVVWLTGPSGSGKSTLARALEEELSRRGCHLLCLDGDNLRHTVNRDLDFTPAGRRENLRRAAAIARLAFEQGQLVICSFVSPFGADRQAARDLFPPGRFLEVYLDCPLEECQRRDPKGLYRRAQEGSVAHFTGVNSAYEAPLNPEIHLASGEWSVPRCLEVVLEELVRRGWIDGREHA